VTQPPLDGLELPEPDAVPDDRTAWWNAAYAAVVERARGERTFTIYEAAHDAGIGEPHHSSMWGVLTGALHRDGVITPVGAAPGRRPTVAKSLVHTWIGTQRAAA